MNFWEQMGITIFMAILQQLKYSPNNVPMFKTILVHVLNDVCTILGVQPPAVP